MLDERVAKSQAATGPLVHCGEQPQGLTSWAREGLAGVVMPRETWTPDAVGASPP